MTVPKVEHKEISLEEFIDAVFVYVTVGILLVSLFLSDEHDVNGYYQNLIIISFSMAPAILHICHEINDNKNKGLEPPDYIPFVYKSSVFLVAFCCAIPIIFYTTADGSTLLSNHIYNNRYWGICFITLIPIIYITYWGYVYLPIKGITYTDVKLQNLQLEDRPE